jgi:hypothetical protein
MRHVEERAGGVALYPHVLGLCEPRERHERPRFGDLGLVLVCDAGQQSNAVKRKTADAQWRRGYPIVSSDVRTVSSKVGDAANGIALDLDVGAEHLPDKRLQPAQRNNQQLVLR